MEGLKTMAGLLFLWTYVYYMYIYIYLNIMTNHIIPARLHAGVRVCVNIHFISSTCTSSLCLAYTYTCRYV